MVFKNKDFRRLNIHTSIIFPLINSGTDCHAELKKDKSWFEKILTAWKKKKKLTVFKSVTGECVTDRKTKSI